MIIVATLHGCASADSNLKGSSFGRLRWQIMFERRTIWSVGGSAHWMIACVGY